MIDFMSNVKILYKTLFICINSLLAFHLPAAGLFHSKQFSRINSREGVDSRITQSCDLRQSSVKISSPSGLGSGALVQDTLGKYGEKGRYYVATAAHVISMVKNQSSNLEEAHKKNLRSKATAITTSGEKIHLDLSKAIVSPLNGGETVLVPVKGTLGLNPLKIAQGGHARKGALQHAGFPDGKGFKQVKSLGLTFQGLFQKNSQGSFTRKNNSGSVKQGMSGGAVVNKNCEIVGVNSEAAIDGSFTNISKI